MDNIPLFLISTIAELLEVHPETLRVWERHGIVRPTRKGRRRFYSNNDLKRLYFIKRLIKEGLNIPAIKHYLILYPCWHHDDCPTCMHRSSVACAKLCWKEEGVYCNVTPDEDSCSECQFSRLEEA